VKSTEVDSIFDLKMHEIARVDKFISVMRVHKGFIYLYFSQDGEEKGFRRKITQSTFVPCDRSPREDKTIYKDCRFINNGSQEWDYNWIPEEAGTRCEYYHQFFRVVNENIIPDCNECNAYEPRPLTHKKPVATDKIPSG